MDIDVYKIRWDVMMKTYQKIETKTSVGIVHLTGSGIQGCRGVRM
jgi:hypothetical protein